MSELAGAVAALSGEVTLTENVGARAILDHDIVKVAREVEAIPAGFNGTECWES